MQNGICTDRHLSKIRLAVHLLAVRFILIAIELVCDNSSAEGRVEILRLLRFTCIEIPGSRGVALCGN